MKKICMIFASAFGVLPLGQALDAYAGSGNLWCPKPACILTFKTHAGWVQRAEISGPIWIATQGNGEGVVHLRRRVPRGNYYIRLIHNRGRGWFESSVRRSGRCLKADDGGGGDRDFNDAIVCIH